MANTTNYNWETPDDTDLVKDGAAAIRTLGSAVDTTTKALNPETTLGDIAYRSSTSNTNTRLGIGSSGQVLTVAGGVPTWATSDDANAIQNAIVDAKGDIVAASAADTPARLAVGTDNQRLVAASGEATGLKYVSDSQNTVIDAEGDLLVGDADNALQRLAIGSNAQILTVDTSVDGKIKWAAPAGGGDLVLVKSQTIGTSVSTVSVSGAFSSTYDAYKIIVSGGSAASDALIELTLGASTSTYYQAIAGVNYSSASVTGRTVNNGSSWLRSGIESSSNGLYMDCTLVNPYLAKWTYFGANFPYSNEGSYSSGYHATATSYTDFTLTAGAAMTGGLIRVYGYKV